MSWADPSRLPSGGRRSAQAWPASSRTPKVMLERPPEIRSKLRGSCTSASLASNQPSTPGRSMPSGASVACAAMSGAYAAAIFDFGGVLTTPVWDSFSAFCRTEGLHPDTVKKLFKTDPEALADLRKLETGEMSEYDFEAVFGKRLGLADPEGLIDSMFSGMRPEDGPALEFLEHDALRPRAAPRVVRRDGDLRRGPSAQAPAGDLPARGRA